MRYLFIFLFAVSYWTAPLSLFGETPSAISLCERREEELLNRLFAVHATRILPENSLLKAGWALNHSSTVEKALFPKVRQTIHFSLGEMVRPVEGVMNWEECPYAVVTPLCTLLPQLLNLNCYDTFILGDLTLSEESFLVLPVDIARTINTDATIFCYDPEEYTLRQAVDMLIALQGGWHIEMDDKDVEDELHEAYFQGINVNTPLFFAPLKKERPWLSVGLRFDALEGEHHRLTQIEMPLLFFTMQLTHRNSETPPYLLKSAQLEELLLMVETHFTLWEASLKGFPWNINSRRAHTLLNNEIEKWASLVKEELRLRELYKKTLFLAPETLLLGCAERLENREALRLFIETHRDALPYHNE